MRYMLSPNIQKFIGIAVNDSNECKYLVLECCQKGSLRGLIFNRRMNLDWEFRNSLIMDLTNVCVVNLECCYILMMIATHGCREWLSSKHRWLSRMAFCPTWLVRSTVDSSSRLQISVFLLYVKMRIWSWSSMNRKIETIIPCYGVLPNICDTVCHHLALPKVTLICHKKQSVNRLLYVRTFANRWHLQLCYCNTANCYIERAFPVQFCSTKSSTR